MKAGRSALRTALRGARAPALALGGGALLYASSRASCEAEPIKSIPVISEHRTKQEFAVIRSGADRIPGSDHDAFLLGANVRCMLGWCRLAIARGYAFGLYADSDALITAAKKLKPDAFGVIGQESPVVTTGKQGDSAKPLLDAKQRDPHIGELSLVLVMARAIPGGHLSHGFSNSVLNRLKSMAMREQGSKAAADAAAAALPSPDRAAALATGQAAAKGSPSPTSVAPPPPLHHPIDAKSAAGGDSRQALELSDINALAGAFTGLPDFVVGDEIAFVWRRDGSLALSVRGQVLPIAITQPRVIRALFDVYAGPSPVSQRGKDTIDKNLKDIANRAVSKTAPIAATPLVEQAPENASFWERFKAPPPLPPSASRLTRPSPAAAAVSPSTPAAGASVALDSGAVVEIVMREHASRSK